MSVLVYIDQSNGVAKKASLEAAFYGSKIAASKGTEAIGVFLGEADASTLASLGNYGLAKVMHANESVFNNFDSKAFTKAVANAADSCGATVVIVPFNQNGKLLAPRLSVRMKAGYIPGASALPDAEGLLRKSVFSGKSYADYKSLTDKEIIGLSANSIQAVKTSNNASVESFSSGVSSADFDVKVLKVETVDGEIPLTEAEIVVSAGRGLKGHRNWTRFSNDFRGC